MECWTFSSEAEARKVMEELRRLYEEDPPDLDERIQELLSKAEKYTGGFN